MPLPTYQRTLTYNDKNEMEDAFDVPDEPVAPPIAALEGSVTGRSMNTTEEIGGGRVVFNVYPGLGKASVTLGILEDIEHTGNMGPHGFTTNGTPIYHYTRTPVFTVVITHPEMSGQILGEVHTCATDDEVLAAVNEVGFG